MPFFGVPIRNGLPIGLGSVAGFGVQRFDPSELFYSGAEGAWYDPSDLSTLFQTTTGTTPAVMPGGGSAVPVGLMLDKSQNGVGTNGSKRVNLLTYSEEFDNAAWTKTKATVTANAVVAPDGTLTADQLNIDATTGEHVIFNTSATFVAGNTYTGSVYLKYKDWQYAFVKFNGIAFPGDPYVTVDLLNKTITQQSVDLDGAVITDVGNDWIRVSITDTADASASGFYIQFSNSATGGWNPSFAGDGTSGIYIWGTDLRLASEASTAPTYQPITSSWYATEAGNHAISYNTTTARPELSARVNLLTYSEDFSDAAWTKFNVTITDNTIVAPDGTLTADKIIANTTNSSHGVYRNFTPTASTAYTLSVFAKAGENSFLFMGVSNAGYASVVSSVWFNLLTGAVGTTGAGYTPSISSVGNGWYRCAITMTSLALPSGAAHWINHSKADNTSSYAGNDFDGIYIWGADLRPANIGANVPAYQRIADANTYDTAGFPLYLRFDGIDDAMYTPANLDLTSTDKATVFAGVRKLSDATAGVLTELSSDISINNGVFALVTPTAVAANSYNWLSRGTLGVDNAVLNAFTAPVTGIITGVGDIAAPLSVNRLNGAVLQTLTTTQGTGNYGTYPLYIGARAGTGVFLNGYLYGLTVVGSQLTTPQIESMESWTAGKTGISIP